MKYKYGKFSRRQIEGMKQRLRKQIFFLLLAADPKTQTRKDEIDLPEAIENVLYQLGGLGELLCDDAEVVNVSILLGAALVEARREELDFQRYRKLVLDAGCEVMKIGGE